MDIIIPLRLPYQNGNYPVNGTEITQLVQHIEQFWKETPLCDDERSSEVVYSLYFFLLLGKYSLPDPALHGLLTSAVTSVTTCFSGIFFKTWTAPTSQEVSYDSPVPRFPSAWQSHVWLDLAERGGVSGNGYFFYVFQELVPLRAYFLDELSRELTIDDRRDWWMKGTTLSSDHFALFPSTIESRCLRSSCLFSNAPAINANGLDPNSLGLRDFAHFARVSHHPFLPATLSLCAELYYNPTLTSYHLSFVQRKV